MDGVGDSKVATRTVAGRKEVLHVPQRAETRFYILEDLPNLVASFGGGSSFWGRECKKGLSMEKKKGGRN